VVAPFDPAPPSPGLEPLSARLRERRRRAAQVGWRAAIDELRPVTADLWRATDWAQKRRFLKHLRPWWDIHRHRMAPAVADAVEDMRARGALTVRAGRLTEAVVDPNGALVSWRARGARAVQTMCVARIINCTGAGGDLAQTRDPLLRRLLDKGAIRPDPLGLGLEVNDACQAIGADGVPSSVLYAAGPLTQGCSWEVVAVPDIRNQVAGLARTLAQRSWTTHVDSTACAERLITVSEP
jgi:uncharacterized NAD(P)/FAD-binding protein YdhS